MQKIIYTIFYKGSGVCPRCGGFLRTCKSDTIILNCCDCNMYLRVVGHGKADSELNFEEVQVGNE